MRASPIAIFVAGFITGGTVLGGLVAQARLVAVNLNIAGIPPKSEGSLFCVNNSNFVIPVRGVFREHVANAQTGGGLAYGVSMQCP